MSHAKVLIIMPMKPGDPTEYTYQWAQKAVELSNDLGYDTKVIEKEKTSYKNVTQTIRDFKPRLFASFSHGCPNSLQGQTECMVTRKFAPNELMAMYDNPEKIDVFRKLFHPLGNCVTMNGICSLEDNICNPICTNETNINELKGTIVFATACFSAKQLGICSTKYGVQSYIGYQDLLMFPVDTINSQDLFGEIQLEFFKSLLFGRTTGQAEQDMIKLEDKYITQYKNTKYVSLPILWNKVNRRVLGDVNATIY